MRKISVPALRPGMVLAKPVYGPDGQLYLNAGVVLKSSFITGLWRVGVPCVYVDDPLLRDAEAVEIVNEQTRRQAVKLLKEMLGSFRNTSSRSNKVVLDKRLNVMVRKLMDEVLENRDVVVNLSDIRAADDYTFCHSVNVCILSLLTGTGLEFPPGKLEDLGTGALLHDMGKVWIDDRILKKRGSLTPEEYEEIRKHPLFGYEILKQQPNISPQSNTVVLQHHERCDGSGYPQRLELADIHPYARLVMVADVYDALTADRPYRKPFQPHQAIEMLSSCVELYESEILRGFLHHLAAFPVGTAVRLSNGDLGLVIKNHKGLPLRPVVRVCRDGAGLIYPEPFDVDLMTQLDLTIIQALPEEEREKEIPLDIKS